jgi:hypothetical protein
MSGIDLDLAIKLGIPLTSAAVGYWQRKRIKESVKKTDQAFKEWMRVKREQKEADAKQRSALAESMINFSDQPLAEAALGAFEITKDLDSAPEEADLDDLTDESPVTSPSLAGERKTSPPLGDKCPGCGGDITKESLACPRCAVLLRKRCPDCGSLLEASWASCPACSYRYPKLYSPTLPPAAENRVKS